MQLHHHHERHLMEEAPVPGIRPALETLRVLDNGRFLDRLALEIRNATDSVHALEKPAKIVITLEIAPLTKQRLSEPAIFIESDIVTKLPKPDAPKALFFIDSDGNPTTTQQRQPDLGLRIAGQAEEGAA